MSAAATICVMFAIFFASLTAGAMIGWAMHKPPKVPPVIVHSDPPATFAWARYVYLGENEYAPR